jgi:transcriptional regulator with XRE-family HTH domain
MALFFDSQWFDARLGALGLARADLARALGLNGEQLAEVFKDQRELSAANVRLIAALLGADPKEIAGRAGVSTPVPREDSVEQRLARLEAEVAQIKSMLKTR